MRLENEKATIGFDSKNVVHLAEFYQQGVEHNKALHPRVAAGVVEKKINNQNRWILDSIFLAGARGDSRKASRLLGRFTRRTAHQRKEETSKRLGWLNEIDSEPAIPNVRNYRRS